MKYLVIIDGSLSDKIPEEKNKLRTFISHRKECEQRCRIWTGDTLLMNSVEISFLVTGIGQTSNLMVRKFHFSVNCCQNPFITPFQAEGKKCCGLDISENLNMM